MYEAPDHEAAFSTGVGAAPSQTEALGEMTRLAMDAAEFLWEMIAMADGSVDNLDAEMRGSTEELLEKSSMLEKQLRGMVSDLTESGESGHLAETSLMEGLSALDALQVSVTSLMDGALLMEVSLLWTLSR